MKSQLLVLDDKDSRREVWHLLHRLPPRERVRFLVDACGRVPRGSGRLPVPMVTQFGTGIDQAGRCDRADERLTNEVYADLLQLWNQFELDAAATAVRLEMWVKRPDARRLRPPARPAAPSASSSTP